jgi:FkbM family methyltransferase
MTSIAIIDVLGLTYDGTTLSNRGLGGSESAVILMSKELAKIGFDVTVFNHCIDRLSAPGVYDGVTYVDHTSLDQQNNYKFDVVISSRSVAPFVPENLYPAFAKEIPSRYKEIVRNAKLKAIWMHDTFCQGDQFLEDLVVAGYVNELFTLSDFHTSYVTTCNHGKRRMFEALKDHIFMTRNGIVLYKEEVDIAAKNPYLYVYNASVTKGMLPLVNKIWPEFKAKVPQAKLKVIGGYYRFRENAEPDEQEKVWRTMVNDPKYSQLGIDFTGIIKQSEIADILSTASFMIYPSAFPETFGISTLESLAYNTPLITTRFGALEETAIEKSCYLIDYAIEPNNVFPTINAAEQEKKFVDLAVWATSNRYLLQQKQYYCNIIKDVCTWDTIAIQWKQHLYKKLNKYLPANEYRHVSKINSRVQEVFNRRFTNKEEKYIPRNTEQPIVVITPVYNAEQYIAQCIESVITQDYNNWKMIVIDDASSDLTYQTALSSIPKQFEDKIVLIRNTENKGAVYNQITAMSEHCKETDIVMLLDGDDCLVNDNQIFHFYNNLYDGTTEFSYGSCWSLVDQIPLVAQPYPKKVKESKSYRQHLFNWNMPYTHLRTFLAKLINDVDDSAFKDETGNWYKAGGDGSVFYTLLENADPEKVKAVQDIVYNYNDINPLNDYKVNGTEQTKNANRIIGKNQESKKMKTILIAIPTNKYIEPETFKSIYDLEVPEGFKTEFQFFYGYQVDQIRNLIASWAERYDYLFSVDSDISFKPDTLKRLLAHDREITSGLYIQRKPGEHILELYRNGRNIPYNDIKGLGLVEVDSCGFGCVLIKSQVIRDMGYPQFVYKSAINHANTVSEDTYFCLKAKEKGYKVFADTTVLCQHHGGTVFKVDNEVPQTFDQRLRELYSQRLLPKPHIDYLKNLSNSTQPRVIYDIGACVLHWTTEAKDIWPESKFIAFEAMDESEFLFKENNMDYAICVLSDTDGKTVDFYQNTIHPGGNSYYKENHEINPNSIHYFNDSHRRTKVTATLDSIVKQKKFPLPDLIKMDVQGAEMDVIKGARGCLAYCKDLILELQVVEYNKGAPLRQDVIEYLKTLGFELVTELFCNNGPDGDYHFRRK